jgi:hypothetical protein
MNSLVLAAVLSLSSLGAVAAEIAKYDEGPFSGPYSESARVGDLLFFAGQVGEYEDGKLVTGGSARCFSRISLNGALLTKSTRSISHSLIPLAPRSAPPGWFLTREPRWNASRACHELPDQRVKGANGRGNSQFG